MDRDFPGADCDAIRGVDLLASAVDGTSFPFPQDVRSVIVLSSSPGMTVSAKCIRAWNMEKLMKATRMSCHANASRAEDPLLR